MRAHNVLPARGIPDDRFRSAVFGRWRASGLTVETMAGLEVNNADGWYPVRPATREPIVVAGATLYVPARTELAALLRRFGRDKDWTRAVLLDQPMPRSAGPNACGNNADRE